MLIVYLLSSKCSLVVINRKVAASMILPDAHNYGIEHGNINHALFQHEIGELRSGAVLGRDKDG
jgi:hypothetical protein